MATKHPFELLSITPAPVGWVSTYSDDQGAYERPVALWLLIKQEGKVRASSFSANGEMDDLTYLDDEEPDFRGYRFDPKVAAGTADSSSAK